VVLLHPTNPGALTVGGQGNTYVNVLGGEVVVNSSASNAITINGGNAIVAAQGYYIKGSPGVDNSGSLKEPNGTTTSSHVYPNSPRQPDPFRHLPEPTPATEPAAFTPQSATLIKKMQGQNVTADWTGKAQPRINALVSAGRLTATEAASFDNFYLLVPGRYGSLSFTGASTLVLFQQATDGGIFNLTQGMTVNGAYVMMDPSSAGGIMLYHTGDGSKGGSHSISFAGSAGKVWLSPPSSGIYESMMIFVSRKAPAPLVSVSGGAQFDIGGSIYSQQGELSLGGSAIGNKIGSQHVSSTMKVAGGANVTVTYNSGLVANERIITLVE
jgi:hypothetical protein